MLKILLIISALTAMIYGFLGMIYGCNKDIPTVCQDYTIRDMTAVSYQYNAPYLVVHACDVTECCGVFYGMFGTAVLADKYVREHYRLNTSKTLYLSGSICTERSGTEDIVTAAVVLWVILLCCTIALIIWVVYRDQPRRWPVM